MAGDVSYMIDIRTQDMGTEKEITSVEALEAAMRKEAASIAVLESMQKRLAKSTAVDTAALERMKSASAAHQSKLAGLTDAYAQHSQSAGVLVEKQKQGSEGSKLWNLALMKLGSTSLASGEQLSAIGGKAGTLMRIVAVAKIVVGSLAAIYRGAKKVVEAGVALGKIAYSSTVQQQNDAVTALGLSKGNVQMATALQSVTGKLGDKYGVSADKLNGFAKELLAADIHGKAFTDSLKALTIEQSATGEADVSGYIEQLKSGKKSAAEMAAETERIFGPAATARGKTLESSIDRIKRRFGEMLATPEVQKGFDSAIGVVENFLKSAEGKLAASNLAAALSTGLKALPGMITTVTNALPALSEGFRAVASVVSSVLGPAVSVVTGLAKAVSGVFRALKSAADSAGVFGGTGATEGAGRWGWMKAKAQADGQAAGQALANGIAAGEASGMAVVQAASAALAAAATSAVTAALEIHSPSRVFARLGRHTAEGFAMGLAANDAPEAAASAMVSAPRERVGAASGGRTITITIGDIVGVKDAEHASDLIEARIAELLEAVAA